MSEIKKYGKEIEDLFIQFMFTDPELYIRTKGITKSEYFNDDVNKEVIEFLEDHSEKYNSIPTESQIKAVTGKKIEKMADIQDSHADWFLSEYEEFCRHKALELVILESINMLKDKKYGAVEKAVKDAVQIGLVRDLGLDYFNDPVARLEDIKNNDGMVSTGWKTVDEKLYGGFNRGGLHIWAAQSGGGKSIYMQNNAVNWATMGMNCVYITLELSENLCSMRLDAMVSGVKSRTILKNVEDVAMKVKSYQRKHKGSIRIKQMPNGCTANDIRAYIKEYQIQTGIKVDAIMVDYLDLMSPNSNKVSVNDTFIKDKYVAEELRNIAIEMNVIMVTASQLNRSSYDEVDYSGSNIAGGLSKINTADNVIGIFTTPAMRENGRYQIQFIKTRSSSGVGSKLDLGFDPDTLKIFDLDEDDDDDSESYSAKEMLDNIKKRKSAEGKSPKGESTKEKDEDKTTAEDLAQQAKTLRDLMR